MERYIDLPRRDGKHADEWKETDESQAAANIEQWYKAGRLLFPRDSIQQVYDQLQMPLVKGDVILVKPFDGLTYEYSVLTGGTRINRGFPGEEKEEELVYGAPSIYYRSYESLKEDVQWSLSRAYCSIQIAHTMIPRGKEQGPGNLDAELQFLNDIRRDWEGSEAWMSIKNTLASVPPNCKIRKVIGMACGTFTEALGSEGSKRSAVQHALLLTLKQALEGSDLGSETVACYAQDPIYSPTGRLVLERSGIKVLDDPEGFLEMDDTSLVFSCGPNICVKSIIADIARPVILILDTVPKEDHKFRCTDPNSPRVREMIRSGYDAFPFPDNHDDSFTPMTIYVKKENRIQEDDWL